MGQGLAAAISVLEKHISKRQPDQEERPWSDDVLTTACTLAGLCYVL